jgi:hypothetical protein
MISGALTSVLAALLPILPPIVQALMRWRRCSSGR